MGDKYEKSVPKPNHRQQRQKGNRIDRMNQTREIAKLHALWTEIARIKK